MCHIRSVKQQSNLYLLTKNTKQKHQFFYEYPIFVGIQTYIPRKCIQYCNFTAHFVHTNIGLSMLFPYYIAVDSTPNRDVSKRSKKSKQNARSKWDAPRVVSKYFSRFLLLSSKSFVVSICNKRINTASFFPLTNDSEMSYGG
jgi:hypothetical protein